MQNRRDISQCLMLFPPTCCSWDMPSTGPFPKEPPPSGPSQGPPQFSKSLQPHQGSLHALPNTPRTKSPPPPNPPNYLRLERHMTQPQWQNGFCNLHQRETDRSGIWTSRRHLPYWRSPRLSGLQWFNQGARQHLLQSEVIPIPTVECVEDLALARSKYDPTSTQISPMPEGIYCDQVY